MRMLIVAVCTVVGLAGCAVPSSLVAKADPTWCGGKYDARRGGTNFIACDGSSPISTTQHHSGDSSGK